MEKNVGGYDRIARLVLGPVLGIISLAALAGYLSLGFGPLSTGVVAALFGVLSLVFIITGATQQCVLNRVLGLNTYRPERSTDTDEPIESRKSI
ncbi:DUF2892 domain-containing protein [Halobellus sp. H-GB7]|mgnify:FL=1|uniref:YgaP family membrane protein n=1 Tax=Halobellus sp. H-GB7 TaxID=3069756 RepID=UPI0027B7A77B|nr:DUF2892 domain-containing protein [Halobellus sp. H-GB7]MDQ2055620.1 DUF2892 domain-containing protein [Halobellus sp. H-GB7]